MIELLPWIIGVVATTHSLIRKDSGAFDIFTTAFLLIVFLYFAYSSIFHNIIVSDFLSILPFHLALLLFLCLAYQMKQVITYESVVEFSESPIAIIVYAVGAISFAFGAAFLDYHWTQYITSMFLCIYIVGLLVTKKYSTLFSSEVMTIIIIISAIASYYVLSKAELGEITPISISNAVSRHMVFSLLTWWFLLYVLASRKIFQKKTFDKLASTTLVMASIGFSTLHPELKEISSPIMKNIIDIAFITGDGGIVGVSLAAMVKYRLQTIV